MGKSRDYRVMIIGGGPVGLEPQWDGELTRTEKHERCYNINVASGRR